MRSTTGVLAVLSLSAFAASAQVNTLHGTVYGGATPLPGTSVVATVVGTSTVVDSDTTDSAGFYALSLPSGTYNLTVTPPASSDFGQQTVRNLAVDGDATYNVILVPASAGSIYGTVRAPGGVALPNVSVRVFTSSGNLFIGSQNTDANGNFSMVVGTGTFRVYYSNNWPPSALEPQQWDCNRYNIPVTAATNADLDLPIAHLAGFVKGSDGANVPGTSFDGYFNGYDSASQTSCEAWIGGSSASDASYAFTAVNGSGNLNLHPPSGYGPVTISLTLDGDASRDLIVPAFNSPLSGTVTLNGAPLGNASVRVFTSAGNQFVGSQNTDSTGYFQFLVGDGSYRLYVSNNWPPSPAEPQQWDCNRYNVAVSGATSADVALTVARLSGSILKEGGAALPGVSFDSYGNSYDPSTSTSCENWLGGSSDSDGAYSVLLFPATYTFNLHPPSGVGAGPLSTPVTVPGDLVHDFVLPAFDKPLGGAVTLNGGVPLPNVSVRVFTSAGNQFVGAQNTDAAGHFEFQVGSGTYRLYFSNNWPPSPSEPQQWDCNRYNVTVTDSATADLLLPLDHLFQTFTDSNGAPIAGVSMNTYSNVYDPVTGTSCENWLGGGSDASGAITQWVLPASYNFQIFPPNGSGFLPMTLNNVGIAQNPTTLAFILPHPDAVPPAIVSGPTVVHLSDDSVSIGWVTDEAADSTVQFGIGSLSSSASQAAFVTQHSVTLTGLTPQAVYQFRVGSSDRSHNGPTWSAQGTFTSQAPPGDITPPVFTLQPSIAFVDMSTAIVQWKTDEPATSVVRWGAAPDALTHTVQDPAGIFSVQHSIAITGLSPSTTYFTAVESSDPDGNGPSVSGILSFTTLAAPDHTAPVITGAPTVVSKTDTRIVLRWITDEPADSGVSFNDGTVYGLVSDTTLTTTHVITISGLHAQTTYHVTVTSSDAVGNGPTLAGPIDVATLATPDTTPPSFTVQPSAATTETTATITWSTSEPSDSSIAFGVNSGAPTDARADLAMVTSHSILLTGLSPGQTYFAVVSSSDASGNKASAQELAFTTHSTAPVASCVGTLTEPVILHTAAHSCGATADSSNAGSCTNGTCTYGGAASVALAPGRREVAVVATAPDGRTASCTSYFDVRDGEAPRLTCPPPSTVECAGALTAARPPASCADNCGCDASCAAGSYALGGPWNVSCEASDSAGNLDGCTAQVTVRDTVAPAVSCGAPVVRECDGPGGGHATPSAAAASDACGLASLTSYGDGVYGFGPTALSFTATDVGGNTRSVTCDSAVTIVDTTPPSIACPAPVTVECAAGGAMVSGFAATGSDLCSASVAADDRSGRYQKGVTAVNFDVHDAHGNHATCASRVTVVDTRKPSISVGVSPAELWPPNHKLVPIAISAAAIDSCDQNPAVRCTVTSSEPADPGPDIVWEGSQLFLRAERLGNGPGRTYTVTCTATDASGNAQTSQARVLVPHDQGR